ncbi:MAG: helicase [Bacteroidales bacterium]|nr:helicase [Bacteroidales bacterium]
MSTKFFNNIETRLMDKFHGIASAMANFDIFHAVVGYFRSSGYFKLRKELENVSEIRILVGINIDNMFHRSQASGRMFFGDREESLEMYCHDFLRDVRQADYSNEVDEGIRQFCEDIATGRLELRIHPTRDLHAKFYLCLPKQHSEHSDGWVIMGSSNISAQGLGISEPPRYELNVAMKDYDDVAYCEQQFQELWENAIPVTAKDMSHIMENTHIVSEELRPTPYMLYMKMLIDHFGNQVEDDFVPLLPTGYDNFTYQRDAVVQGYDIMMRHGGCFIADVVGLGKTVVAAMIAQRFIAANGDNTRILVIFPPAVQSNWTDTFDDFHIKNKYSRFITNGSLDKIINGDGYDEKEFYDLVIVDEAHNFRHDSTGSYDLLQRITKSPRLNKGNVNGGKRVLLLSATPLNNTPEDIKNQLLLFQDTARCTIDGVSNIADTFAPWIKEYKGLMSHRERLSPEVLAATTDKINKELRHTVLEKVMVRRTRSNIQHEPRYSGEIHFPKLLDPEDRTYQMTPDVMLLFVETYKKLVDTPTANLKAVYPDMFDGSGLRYARYRAVEYCPKYEISSGQKAKQLADSLAGIYRTHMVKRLESSFDAFKHSLHTLLNATNGMIKMFEEDKVIIAPDLNVKKLQSDGMELDQIIELALGKGYEQDKIVFQANDFLPEFKQMLDYDAKLLETLCNSWDKVKADPKLDLFVDMLQGELFDPKRNPNGKLVVFSESVDTVNYLTSMLQKRLQRNDILSVCSSDRNRKREDIRANFDANYKGHQRNDYNIIVTSDVLAEGINLHRANVIVNYDSPWNATRLMQRIGRVNRIGSTAPAIYNYMFYPSDPGDAIISLKKNSLIKLQSFHSALGEDTKIYSHDEIVQEFKLFNSDVTDDTDLNLELLREVRALHDSDAALYRRIKQIPSKSSCARKGARQEPTVGKGTVTYLSSETKKAFYLVGEHVKELSFLEAATIMRSSPDEKSYAFGSSEERHYRQVGMAMQQYSADQQRQHQEERPKIGGRDNDAKKAAAFLREIRPSLPDEDAKATASRLKLLVERGTYNQLADNLNRMSRSHKKNPMSIMAIIERLEELDKTYGHKVSEASTPNQTVVTQAEIILSETFI